jgi:hypothetical protein
MWYTVGARREYALRHKFIYRSRDVSLSNLIVSAKAIKQHSEKARKLRLRLQEEEIRREYIKILRGEASLYVPLNREAIPFSYCKTITHSVLLHTPHGVVRNYVTVSFD